MKIKYAALVFKSSYRLPIESKPYYFLEKTFIQSGQVKDFFNEGADIAHWREWIGSTRWEEAAEGDDLILSWDHTSTPEILDAENRKLVGINFEFLRCFPIATSYCFSHGENFFALSGSAEMIDGVIKIVDIREFTTYPSYKRSFFLEPSLELPEDPYYSDAVLDDWKNIYELIMKNVFDLKHRQLMEALRSFEEAFRSSQLEFKIPNLVRSVECLIDCWGAQQFAERVIWYIGLPPADDNFEIHLNYKEKLQDIYQLRNDCSHGKEFAWSLSRKLGRNVNDKEVAMYELLIEWVARQVFMRSINSSFTDIFTNRDKLSAAWKDYKKVIPKK